MCSAWAHAARPPLIPPVRAASKIGESMERLAVSVSNTVNPNHRHDEAHEKAADAARQAICDVRRHLCTRSLLIALG